MGRERVYPLFWSENCYLDENSMATKRILLAVADPQILQDAKQALGEGWETTTASTDAEVLAQLEQGSFDALLVDFNLSSPDASELVNQAYEKRPETLQFLLAYEADLALIAAKVLGPHELLPKPLEPSFKARIEEAISASSSGQAASEPAPKAESAPALPPIYAEVLKALDTPGVTSKQVGALVGSDKILLAEVLGLARSAYLGLPGNLNEPVAAVEALGLDAMRALIMALKFLAEHSQNRPGYLALEQIWQHSKNVARIARDLVLFETKDRTLATQAFAAGLLHDLGKVVLAANFDDLYGRVHSLARKQPVALWDVEKEMFGANHGEIGACLIGMWNLPGPIVEAAAMHHEPPLGEQEQFTPLAAVHIANVLEHEMNASDDLRVAPVISTPFVNELGLLARLPVWRATLANGAAANGSAAAGSDKAANAGKRSSASNRKRPEPEESGSFLDFWHRPWVYGSIALGVLLLMALLLRPRPTLDESVPVYARTPAASAAPAVAPQNSIPEPAIAVAPEETTEPAVAEAPTPSDKASVAEVSVEPQPAPVTNSPVISPVARQQEAAPDFRLNGIIYSAMRPSALINGETVYVGERVNGASVLEIRQNGVTLLINGQRKTLTVR